MAYMVNGAELETDVEGYLLAPDYSEEAVRVIAQAEGIEADELLNQLLQAVTIS